MRRERGEGERGEEGGGRRREERVRDKRRDGERKDERENGTRTVQKCMYTSCAIGTTLLAVGVGADLS